MTSIDVEKVERYWMPRHLKMMYGDMTTTALLGMIGFKAESGVTKEGLVVEEGGRVKFVTLRGEATVEWVDIIDEDGSIYHSVSAAKQ